MISETKAAVSFRDPGGTVVRLDRRIIRLIRKEAVPDFQAFLATDTARKHSAAGSLVGSHAIDASIVPGLLSDAGVDGTPEGQDIGMVVEHNRIPFASFPYEWPPDMLHAAAQLTLDLSQDLLAEGFGLKDATPYNILFRGPEPVFIDVLSFERRHPGDPTWLPYAQFLRTFVLPLLANRRFDVPLSQVFLVRRDGYEPQELYRLCGWADRLRSPFLPLVSLPTWLNARAGRCDGSLYGKRRMQDAERARFVVAALLRQLRNSLGKVAPKPRKDSAWLHYMEDSQNNYPQAAFVAKDAFCRQALTEFAPASVLDVGCNTGHFSIMAAECGAHVVAIDYDPVVVGQVWRRARAEGLDILPLVVDLTRPSPGIGWRNNECPAFLDRASGAFDAVLMLAVVHHMLVTERVPLDEIVDLAAALTTDLLIIEFISPEDSMFRRLARGRDELHQGLTPQVFEDACRRRFSIIRCQHAEGSTRWLYVMRRNC